MKAWMILIFLLAAAPWIFKVIYPHKITILESVVSMVVACVAFSVIFFFGKYNQTLDYEIWSGEIVKKERNHGSYVRSYSCNCRSVCSGSGKNEVCSEQCDTCYEDRYTVTWEAISNIGKFTIKSLDSGSSTVYFSPDPQRYSIIQNGDPVSKKVAFTNYVKAVPDSIFHNKVIDEKFKKIIPDYPDKVYDFYHIDRVLDVGVNIPLLSSWNKSLSSLMCELGYISKANIVIVFVNTSDESYVESLKTSWLNGKKNDVIIVIGMTSYPNIDWVRVFGWSDEELFKLELADEIRNQKKVNPIGTLDIIKKHVQKSFKYKNMDDFEYLENEVEPPIWVIILAVILSLMISFFTTIFVKNQLRKYY